MAAIPVSLRIPAKRAYLTVMLNALVNLNRLQLRQVSRFPGLYESGVRYKREARDPRTGQRLEEWRTIAEVLDHRGGDCEDLAGYLIAELREKGINAKPWLTKHGRTWHVRVKLPNGKIVDPSKDLGMQGPA